MAVTEAQYLIPPLHLSANIKDLERLWLEAACAYEVFDDPILSDADWDELAIELLERHQQLSPYFLTALRYPWPMPSPELGENPFKTGSGVNWDEGLPAIVVEGLKKERPKRLARWRSRFQVIREEADKRDLGWLFDERTVDAVPA